MLMFFKSKNQNKLKIIYLIIWFVILFKQIWKKNNKFNQW